MKPVKKFIPALALGLLLAGLAGCSKPAGDPPAAVPEKPAASDQAGVTLDAETRERIGLQTAAPAPAQWQPQIHAAGIVVDPQAFLAAVTDVASARAAADMSRRELERTRTLADQNNVSARALETAQAAATHDALALESAQAAFTTAWGATLAQRTNLVEFARQLAGHDTALVKVSLPVGTILHPVPPSATIGLLDDETNSLAAAFVDDLGIDPATQTQTLLFSADGSLPRGAAVTASLAVPGDPVGGVAVPFSAVLRHEGEGWVYVQSGTNQFVRTAIPLDRLMAGGWFVSENLSATNQVIVTGAQTVLSKELGVSAAAGD